jgi:hypothetical protein
MFDKKFSAYYASHGAVIWGGFFSSGREMEMGVNSEFMTGGGEAGGGDDGEATGDNSSQGDDFVNSEKGRILVPSKITKDELQSIISGKSKVSNGDTVQFALAYIRREKGANSIHRGTKSDTEKERLIEFIDRNNLWYAPELNPDDSLGRGGEHIVYPDPNDKDFVLKTNNLSNYASWSDYLINLLLNNTFFPDTSYELIGFKNEHGNVLPVVKQHFVPKPVVVANLKDVQKYLFNRGFVKVHPLVNAYRNWDLGIILGDLHDRNVLLKDDVLFFIDTKFFISHNVDYVYNKGGDIKYFDKKLAAAGAIDWESMPEIQEAKDRQLVHELRFQKMYEQDTDKPFFQVMGEYETRDEAEDNTGGDEDVRETSGGKWQVIRKLYGKKR